MDGVPAWPNIFTSSKVSAWPRIFMADNVSACPATFSHFASKANFNSRVSPSCNVIRPRHKTEHDCQDINTTYAHYHHRLLS